MARPELKETPLTNNQGHLPLSRKYFTAQKCRQGEQVTSQSLPFSTPARVPLVLKMRPRKASGDGKLHLGKLGPPCLGGMERLWTRAWGKRQNAYANKETALIYQSNSPPFREREHEIAQNDLQSGTHSD